MWLLEINKAIEQLEQHLPNSTKHVLDIGSEGEEYRNVRQPWNKKFYDYFKNKRINVSTLDSEPKTRPKILHDITKPINNIGKFDLVVATHLLEHIPLEFFDQTVKNIESLIDEGGYLLVSVPHKYPYHERPIDNLWRPTWQELKDVFSGALVFGETFEVDHTSIDFEGQPKCQISLVFLRY